MHERIQPPTMPKPFSLYSPAIRAGNVIYVAGQLPINSRGEIEGETDIIAQTRRVLENIRLLLAAAGASVTDVVKTTVYLTDMKYFADMNQVYKEYFGDALPARTTVQVVALADKSSLIEIDAIAVIDGWPTSQLGGVGRLVGNRCRVSG